MAEFPVSNQAAPLLLNTLVRSALVVDEDLSLRLFTNDYTPTRASTLVNYVEAVGQWYSRRLLPRSSWNAPTLNLNTAEIVSGLGPQAYVYSGPGETIYGSFLVGAVTGIVYYARRFVPPRALAFGNTLNVLPMVTLTSAVL